MKLGAMCTRVCSGTVYPKLHQSGHLIEKLSSSPVKCVVILLINISCDISYYKLVYTSWLVELQPRQRQIVLAQDIFH